LCHATIVVATTYGIENTHDGQRCL
jgi:hypothetical protein